MVLVKLRRFYILNIKHVWCYWEEIRKPFILQYIGWAWKPRKVSEHFFFLRLSGGMNHKQIRHKSSYRMSFFLRWNSCNKLSNLNNSKVIVHCIVKAHVGVFWSLWFYAWTRLPNSLSLRTLVWCCSLLLAKCCAKDAVRSFDIKTFDWKTSDKMKVPIKHISANQTLHFCAENISENSKLLIFPSVLSCLWIQANNRKTLNTWMTLKL